MFEMKPTKHLKCEAQSDTVYYEVYSSQSKNTSHYILVAKRQIVYIQGFALNFFYILRLN